MIRGLVNKVIDQVLALRETTGDFGELVYAGVDWMNSDLTKRSMELMADQAMLRINGTIAALSRRNPL